MEVQRLTDQLGAALDGAADPACRRRLAVYGLCRAARFRRSVDLPHRRRFTYGEGPCLDAVAQRRPVLADDLDRPGEGRWPALAEAILGYGIRAVYALPVAIASTPIGALDLFRRSSGPLNEAAMTGGLWAKGLAALPLLDLMTSEVDWDHAAAGGGGWEPLASLERVEVYQATGMIVGALDVTPADALIRLRAHAISHGLTASEVAYRILNRQLIVSADDWHDVDHRRET